MKNEVETETDFRTLIDIIYNDILQRVKTHFLISIMDKQKTFPILKINIPPLLKRTKKNLFNNELNYCQSETMKKMHSVTEL